MDRSYENLLPLIRLRSDAPEWLVPLLLGFVVALVLSMIAYPLIRRFRWQRNLWNTFGASAEERGLSDKQRRLLERVARADKMKHPLLLLTSLKAFDRHVGGYAGKLDRRSDQSAEPRLNEITEIRRQLGFDRPAPGQPVYSTREIQVGQTIMVWPVKGGPKGFCSCFVIHVDERAITVVPLISEENKYLNALTEGDKVKVRFWREGDTEYRFRSQVVETMPEATTVKIRHSQRLEHIQKRDFFRLDTNFSLSLFPAVAKNGNGLQGDNGSGDPDAIEVVVTNVSGGGLAVVATAAIETESVLTVDPKFEDSFPLAGLVCRVIKVLKDPRGHRMSLEFVDLPPQRERELVRTIYTYQHRRVVA